MGIISIILYHILLHFAVLYYYIKLHYCITMQYRLLESINRIYFAWQYTKQVSQASCEDACDMLPVASHVSGPILKVALPWSTNWPKCSIGTPRSPYATQCLSPRSTLIAIAIAIESIFKITSYIITLY